MERASVLGYRSRACLVTSRKHNLWPSWRHSII